MYRMPQARAAGHDCRRVVNRKRCRWQPSGVFKKSSFAETTSVLGLCLGGMDARPHNIVLGTQCRKPEHGERRCCESCRSPMQSQATA